MTLSELEAMECNTLTVKQVAEFLGKSPQLIRDQAEENRKFLGFPICKVGHSWCIPRIGFINWYKGFTPILAMVLPDHRPVDPEDVLYGRILYERR